MISEKVLEIMDKIKSKGYQIFLVGGFVRDYILGIENNDYDLCTNCSLNEIKELFPDFVIMKENNHRNTGIIRDENIDIEISEFRGNTLKEDIKLRDFTINSLAMDNTYHIYDYYGGKKDIDNKIIRLIDEYGKGLENDPLRILRAIRFALKYNFEIDNETKNLIISKSNLLDNVAKERILKELDSIIVLNNPQKYITEYKEVFSIIIPRLSKAIGSNQNNPNHIYDVFEHTMKVIENKENNVILRYAALFHDLGKPFTYTKDENNIGHFYGHPNISSKIFLDFANEYKMDNKRASLINLLIFNHDNKFSTRRYKIKSNLSKIGIENIDLLFKLKEDDIKAQNPEKINEKLLELEYVKNRYNEIIHENPCLRIKDLDINLYDLIEIGIEERQIGLILRDLLDLVINEEINNNKEELIEYVLNNYLNTMHI